MPNRRHAFYVVLSRLAFSLVQWSLISILAHSGDVEAIGILGAALAVSMVSFGFFNMGLRQGIATDLSGSFSDSSYWVFRILTGGLASAAIVLFASTSTESRMAFAVTLAVLLPKLAESFSEAAYGFFQRTGDLRSIAYSQLLRAVLTFIAFLVIYTATASLFWATIAWGAGQFAVFFFTDRNATPPTAPKPLHLRGLPLLQIALTQLPIALGTLIGDVGLLTPRFLVDALASDFELGRFTAVYYLFQAANILVLSLLLTFLSPLACTFQKGQFAVVRQQVFRFQLLLMLCCAAGLLIAVLAGDRVLRLLYGADFQDLDRVFVLLAAGWSFKYMALVPRVFLTAGRYFSTGMVMDTISTSITISFCLYFYIFLETDLIHLSIGFLLAQGLSLVCFNVIFLYLLRVLGARSKDGAAVDEGG